MSRIQEILSKAEREGTARRTRSLGDEYGTPPVRDARPAFPPDDDVRGYVEGPPGSAGSDESRAARRPPLDVPRTSRSSTAAAFAPDPEQAARPDAAPRFPSEGEPAVGTPQAIGGLDPLLVAALAPTSLAAEQYRSLRTRLKRLEGNRALRTIAITSPSKGDGKSLTAANLALTMAQEFQQRVLLVDADLRRPYVHHLFGLADAPGLADVVMDMAELDQALVALPDHRLTVLPAGVPPSHPAELLGSSAMRRTLETLRSRFDKILIDVPPVAPLADLHILAPMIDGLLLIVRAGVTPKPAIERALAGLDASKVLGLVLNESGGESSDAYNYEGYGYIAG